MVVFGKQGEAVAKYVTPKAITSWSKAACRQVNDKGYCNVVADWVQFGLEVTFVKEEKPTQNQKSRQESAKEVLTVDPHNPKTLFWPDSQLATVPQGKAFTYNIRQTWVTILVWQTICHRLLRTVNGLEQLNPVNLRHTPEAVLFSNEISRLLLVTVIVMNEQRRMGD